MILLKSLTRRRAEKLRAQLYSERIDIVIKKNERMHSTELVKLICRERSLVEKIELIDKILQK